MILAYPNGRVLKGLLPLGTADQGAAVAQRRTGLSSTAYFGGRAAERLGVVFPKYGNRNVIYCRLRRGNEARVQEAVSVTLAEIIVDIG